eukprot:1725321-Rhodomonas_salina.1
MTVPHQAQVLGPDHVQLAVTVSVVVVPVPVTVACIVAADGHVTRPVARVPAVVAKTRAVFLQVQVGAASRFDRAHVA